jgi:hypothetical protein
LRTFFAVFSVPGLDPGIDPVIQATWRCRQDSTYRKHARLARRRSTQVEIQIRTRWIKVFGSFSEKEQEVFFLKKEAKTFAKMSAQRPCTSFGSVKAAPGRSPVVT